jgi:AraC-like DNA-binding protein
MIFVYDHTDFKLFLQDIADRFLGSFDCETMVFSKSVAEGYIKLIELPGGLQVIVSDYVLNSDFTFFRKASLPEYFNFRVDYIDQSDGLEIKMGEDEFTVTSSVYTNVQMFSSRYNAKASLQKGAKLKGLGIVLKKEWLEKYFPEKVLSFWLNHTHILRSNNVTILPLDFEARETLLDLISLDETHPAFLFFVQARIYELLDYYFEQVSSKRQLFKNTDAFLEDVGRITELDIFFTNNILAKGELPSIDEMAKHAGMSASKLKTVFKKVYNQSIGDYFNACRLNMASTMLLKEKMEIKEVSATLGYNSVQHFTTAFKNHFGRPPASLFKNSIP